MTHPSAINRWLKYPHTNPEASLRLFCFPYAGGNAFIYRTWGAVLPSTVELCAIELPGRGTRWADPPFTELTSLVEAIAPILRPTLDRPFALFGHSMGGMISFELARYLRREYRLQPAHLFISSSRAPQLPRSNPPIHNLPEPDFVAKLRAYNGTPEAVLENDELMQLLIPALRADFTLLETYAYTEESPLDCPITVLGGDQDPEVSPSNLAAWQQQTQSTFRQHLFPGDHFFLHAHQTQLLQLLGQALTQCISDLSAEPG